MLHVYDFPLADTPLFGHRPGRRGAIRNLSLVHGGGRWTMIWIEITEGLVAGKPGFSAIESFVSVAVPTDSGESWTKAERLLSAQNQRQGQPHLAASSLGSMAVWCAGDGDIFATNLSSETGGHQ